jgi:PAS domain-containing protein
MQNLTKSRYTFLITVILLYLIPMTLISNYGRLYMPAQKGWNLLAFGLFCSAVGTLVQFWMLCRWGTDREEDVVEEEPEAIAPVVNAPQVIVDESQTKAINELQELLASEREAHIKSQEELADKQDEIQTLYQQHEDLRRQLEVSSNGYESYKESIVDQLEEQKKQLADSQKTIVEQRESIDKKLQQIVQLESKVSDLTYEIKTLIQLAEIENQTMPMYPNSNAMMEAPVSAYEYDEDAFCLPEKQVKNREQASIQLKRCIDIAQKITGASYYNNANSRFKDLAVDNYALDLRRLFESLRMENASTLIFYSQKENKILFVNNQSRNLLGWSPDKFVQSFTDIVEPSLDVWKQGISSLSIKNETVMMLKMKSKAGQQLPVQSLLGIIPTGIFRNHILGVLYASESH